MPRNERLQEALLRAGVTTTAMAEDLAVDPKTVERWVTGGRTPYRRHRQVVARLLGVDEAWLWPDAAAARLDGESEVRRIHAHRFEISIAEWVHFFRTARERIDILVYAGLFLPEQTPGLCELFSERADAGARVRIVLGDPDCDAVRVRGQEEGIGDAVAVKIRNSLRLYQPLADSGVEVRLHATTLYTSIYRSDDELIASLHVLGLPGGRSPALHLRRRGEGELFDTYAECFDRVWDGARPAWPEGDDCLMARRDYFHDPEAPRANSLVVAATAYVQNDQGQVLLVRRSDNGAWALPGGQQEIGETTAACVERETFEETGFRVRVTELVDVLSDPGHVIAYDDGEVRQEFVVLYRAELIDGDLRTSEETPLVTWAALDELEQYDMKPWIRERVLLGRGG